MGGSWPLCSSGAEIVVSAASGWDARRPDPEHVIGWVVEKARGAHRPSAAETHRFRGRIPSGYSHADHLAVVTRLKGRWPLARENPPSIRSSYELLGTGHARCELLLSHRQSLSGGAGDACHDSRASPDFLSGP